MKRGGIDPISMDRRPLSQVLNDEIPYHKWECEKMFKKYRRKQIAELRPYVPGEALDGVSISVPDKAAGSPKEGDMIARNPKNHEDQWLVAAQYFADNFEPV